MVNPWWIDQFLAPFTQVPALQAMASAHTEYGDSIEQYNVQGTMVAALSLDRSSWGRKPHTLTIQFPWQPIPASTSATLLHQLASRPDWVAQLIQRQLPPALNDLWKTVHRPLLPSRYTEYKINCSCRRPGCMHQADLLARMAQDLAALPLMILGYHGLSWPLMISQFQAAPLGHLVAQYLDDPESEVPIYEEFFPLPEVVPLAATPDQAWAALPLPSLDTTPRKPLVQTTKPRTDPPFWTYRTSFSSAIQRVYHKTTEFLPELNRW